MTKGNHELEYTYRQREGGGDQMSVHLYIDEYLEVNADDVDGLDGYIETRIEEAISENASEEVDAKAVAVEILRMLIDLLEQQ